uniref:Uncharacterized protein n=1 Tax=Anopheles culicifacies TaxID=139723 RepID=A0A182MAZ4_9DIPT
MLHVTVTARTIVYRKLVTNWPIVHEGHPIAWCDMCDEELPSPTCYIFGAWCSKRSGFQHIFNILSPLVVVSSGKMNHFMREPSKRPNVKRKTRVLRKRIQYNMGAYTTQTRWGGTILIAIVIMFIIVVRSSSAADSICERIDFNDINTWKVQQCSGPVREIFRLRAYGSSPLFRPFRESVTYFLSNDVRGISCTESINSFYMNAFTEIRMIYQLMFRSPCLLTLMVFDLDMMDQYGEPLLAQNWTTRAQTSTWSLFVGKVEREIRRARIQLQADMSADGELAIEYITVFNPLVLEDFCMTAQYQHQCDVHYNQKTTYYYNENITNLYCYNKLFRFNRDVVYDECCCDINNNNSYYYYCFC